MKLPRVSYKNTGLMRQVFVYWMGRYAGLEFSRRYIRLYGITREFALPKYHEIRRRR